MPKLNKMIKSDILSHVCFEGRTLTKNNIEERKGFQNSVLGVECLGVDCGKHVSYRTCRVQEEDSHPGTSVGSLVESADEKHSTSESPESEDPKKAPRAAKEERKNNVVKRYEDTKTNKETHPTIEHQRVPSTPIQPLSIWDCGLSRNRIRAWITRVEMSQSDVSYGTRGGRFPPWL